MFDNFDITRVSMDQKPTTEQWYFVVRIIEGSMIFSASKPGKCSMISVALATLCWTAKSFLPVARLQISRRTVACPALRRDFLSSLILPSSLAVLLPLEPSIASEGEDLTSQLFNPDGSLKEGVESEIKFRKVEFEWGPSDELLINQDGVNIGDTKTDSKLHLSYEYPLRWSDGKSGDPVYFDRSEGTNAKACKRITVYQSAGVVEEERLEKATAIGVAKALAVPKSDLGRLYMADIISGKTSERGSQTYYEFDMAAAPDSCGNSKENLGLGFCPYDNIFLLSATIVNRRLYCIVVECDDTKIWKLASAELKRVRSSFRVEDAT